MCDPTSAYGHSGTTLRAQRLIHSGDADIALRKHLHGTWGELDPVVFENGAFRGAHGILRLTVHFDRHGTKFGVVTTARRLETTIVMPDELCGGTWL